jgi:hypothetical protein
MMQSAMPTITVECGSYAGFYAIFSVLRIYCISIQHCFYRLTTPYNGLMVCRLAHVFYCFPVPALFEGRISNGFASACPPKVLRAHFLAPSVHSLTVCRAIYPYDVTPPMIVCNDKG